MSYNIFPLHIRIHPVPKGLAILKILLIINMVVVIDHSNSFSACDVSYMSFF